MPQELDVLQLTLQDVCSCECFSHQGNRLKVDKGKYLVPLPRLVVVFLPELAVLDVFAVC